MANDPSRTEKATPKRREKARKEDMVLRVPDLDATIMLWGNLFLFMGAWGAAFALLGNQVAYYLRKTAEIGYLADGNLSNLAWDLFLILLKVLIPFLGANFLLALTNQLVQHGFKPDFTKLTLKPERLNPASGFKRIISPKSAVDIVKSAGKFLIIGTVAYTVLGPRIPLLLLTLKLPLGQSIQLVQETLFILYRNVMIAMLIMALADFLYQRHAFEKGIRMTKQEVKDEMKDAEGNPEIKRRQRTLQMQGAMRRIITEVPKASVVITNPTHFAVALRYDPTTAAPILVAKGVDHLALKIRERALETGIPILERPELARALYRVVEVEKAIPRDLYQAVAQVLAFVYRLRGAA
jgi:flagellar biosynthesis protein FlhB